MSQLEMFRQNIRLLVGILTLTVFGGIALVAGWTALRAWRLTRRQRRGMAQFERSRRDAAGQPLPPAGMGICTSCGAAGPEVLHLPGGARLCRRCHESRRAGA